MVYKKRIKWPVGKSRQKGYYNYEDLQEKKNVERFGFRRKKKKKTQKNLA